MTRDELLNRLQPPALPVEPGHWPPAVAWWVLLSLLILLCGTWLAWRVYRYRYQFFHQASLSLDAINQAYRQHNDANLLLLQLAGWLRQVALATYSDPKIKTIHGEAWLAFLEQDLPAADFSQGPGKVFGESLYQAGIQFDSQAVLQLCYRWLACCRQNRKRHAAV